MAHSRGAGIERESGIDGVIKGRYHCILLIDMAAFYCTCTRGDVYLS